MRRDVCAIECWCSGVGRWLKWTDRLFPMSMREKKRRNQCNNTTLVKVEQTDGDDGMPVHVRGPHGTFNVPSLDIAIPPQFIKFNT